MSDLSLIPLQDGFETQLSQDWDGNTGTIYVLATPSYTPTTTNTYIVVNPGKTNMQIAEITDYDSVAKTLTVSSISFEKGLGISSTAQSHSTGSKVIISDNYQFWEDIQTAVNSKLDKTGGNALVYATTTARDTALGANGVPTTPYTNIYVTDTGLFYDYNLSTAQWESRDTGTTPGNATTSSAGLVRSSVAPAGVPVALITDDDKYKALAGTSGTPSSTNKYVTNDDTGTSGAGKCLRLDGSGKVPVAVIDIPTSDNTLVGGETGNAGQAVFAEPVATFAEATNAQNIGDVSGNTRVSFPAFLSGIAGNTLKLALAKVVSPSVNLGVRIETDNAGSPSGTLVDANAYGSITAASLSTSLSDTTITLNGSFSGAKGTPVHTVLFQGTYASETVNSSNYYVVGYSANDSTTRKGKHYNGSTYTTGAGGIVSESADFSSAGGGTDSSSYGYRILANTNCYILSATTFSSVTATRMRLFTDAGVLLATATITANVGTFTNPVPLTAGEYYRIESDNSGSNYQTYNDASATFPTGVNINYITGSANQANYGGQRNITHVSTISQNNYFFPYLSSALFEQYVLSLTDADFSYKIDWLGVLFEAMTVGGSPKVVLSGIDSNQSLSGVSNRADLYLSNTPGNISSTPGTNQKTIGIKHSDTKILVEKKLTLKTSTSGVTSGTAETDMFVNAYATSGGTNQTLIGTSNGNTMQSCSSGNIGGTTQWSICFPVKKGATWSVTGSMGSITVWTTPLS